MQILFVCLCMLVVNVALSAIFGGWLLHSTTYTLKSQIRYKKTRKIALKKAVKKLAFLNSLFVSAIKLRGVIRD